MKSQLLYLAVTQAWVAGVHFEEQESYLPVTNGLGEEVFRCLSDHSIEIPFEKVNDNHVDCPDGSDEPGTAANPHGMFWCENKGFIGQWIPTYIVGDGVCDYERCCDGSDEHASGLCPNRCADVKQQFDEFRERVDQQVENALAIQQRMVEAASVAKANELSQVAKIKDEMAAMEKHAGTKNSDKADEVSVRDVEKYIESQHQQIEQLKNILSRLMANFNPNYNDGAVKEATQRYQQFLGRQSQVAAPDLSKFTNEVAESSKTPTFTNMVHYYMEKIVERFSGNNHSENESMPSIDATSLPEKYHQYRRMLDQYHAQSIDFGPRDILRAATNTLSARYGEYSYRIQYLRGVYQDDVTIGLFSSYDPETFTLEYTSGDRCWNGPLRSAKVHLVCGDSEKLIVVSEPEKCSYSMEVSHPMACHPMNDSELYSVFELDYESLY
ncbi:hypothetical protein DICA3_F30504 [Diutina catenulata]